MTVSDVKPWITDPQDRAYIETRQRRLDVLDKERKKLQRQIADRERHVWESGGRSLFLGEAVEGEVTAEPCPKCRGGFLCDDHRQAVA